MRGLVPRIPLRRAPPVVNRDGRDKPGHDEADGVSRSGVYNMKIGLVGLGRMGSAIAQRLTERGCEVIAWDKNAKALAAQGNRVKAAGNPRAVAAAADVVVSIITEDKGVRRIFTGADGFLAGDVAGKLFIEMSTLQPM